MKNETKIQILIVSETDFASGEGHKRRILTVVRTLVDRYGKESVDWLVIVPSGLNLVRTYARMRRIRQDYDGLCGRLSFLLNIQHPLVRWCWAPIVSWLATRLVSRYPGRRVVIWSEMTHSALPLLRAKRQLSVPLIVDIHGIADEVLQRNIPSNKRQTIYAQSLEQEKTILKAADGWVAVSNKMLAEHKNRVAKKPAWEAVIPNTADEKRFVWNPAQRKSQRATLRCEDNFVFVYSGGVQRWQSIDSVLRLMASIDQHEGFRSSLRPFFLFLTWDKNFSFDKKLAELGIRLNNAKFRHASETEVPAYLQAADAGILLREDNIVNRVSCPTKAAEYLLSGLPIITTPFAGDVSDIVKENNVGLVLPNTSVFDGDAIERWCGRVNATRSSVAERCVDVGKRFFGSDKKDLLAKAVEQCAKLSD